jgi:HEAT repeat protein
MTRWLVVLILCFASLVSARPNNGAEAAKVLDSFLQGQMALNAAINRVQFLGEEAFVSGELVQAMRRSSGKLRGQILEFLVALAVRDVEVESLFLRVLKSDDIGEVMSGARGLGRIKSNAGVRPLIAMLGNSALGPRREAARALGEIGRPEAAAPLLKASKAETDLDLRLMMITAAGLSRDKKQIPAFEALLKDDSESTRLAAGRALCLLAAPKCAQYAGTLLASKDTNERFQGVMLFEGSPAKIASPTLTPLLKERDDKLRARAARILVQGGDPKGLEWLVIESAKAKGEARLLYEDELEKVRITDEQRQAILKKAGLQ